MDASLGAAPGVAPRISIVIPVFRIECELRACLDSILGQQGAGFEVIAVDDHSPDRSGEILDAYARQDSRVRIVHLPQSCGPGGARNIGLDHATGEYVWFVDGDDVLTEGALAAVTAQLARAEPDVLLIGFARLQPSGAVLPNVWRQVLREDHPGQVFALADRQDVVRLTMTSWSKVIRRGFLTGLGLRFEPGIHEDVPLTCGLLLYAERIATLSTVCYLYREHRGGALTNSPSYANFDVFRRYEKVFALIESQQDRFGMFRGAFFDRAIWHYTTVFGAPGGVPRAARRGFFHRMAEDFARYRPAGYRYPAGLHGMKYRLVERDAYHAYLAIQPLNAARVRLRNMLQKFR
jgi:CDP-glycerol glycerophosphotransferase